VVAPKTSTGVSLVPRAKRTELVLRARHGERVETTTCVRCGVYPASDDVALAWINSDVDLEMHHVFVRCCAACAREESGERWRAPVFFTAGVAAMIAGLALTPLLATASVVFGLGSLAAGLWQLRRTRARSLTAEGLYEGGVKVIGPGALGEVLSNEAPERLDDGNR
jgi:hypothetical protein